MTGFLATLAIAAAGIVLGLIIAHFSSSRREDAQSVPEVEQLTIRLSNIEREAREARLTVEAKSLATHEVAGRL